MAFEKYESVDIKYSPVTEDMGVREPSNFLRDGGIRVSTMCRWCMHSVNLPVPHFLFPPAFSNREPCVPRRVLQARTLAVTDCFWIDADIAIADAAS